MLCFPPRAFLIQSALLVRFIHTKSLSKLPWQDYPAQLGYQQNGIALLGHWTHLIKWDQTVLFSFLFGLGLLSDGTPVHRGHTASPVSLYMLLFGRGRWAPAPACTHWHTYLVSARVGWLGPPSSSHGRACQRGIWAGAAWWRGALEIDAPICSVRATAEMNRERSGACVPLDLISPTCPCHSDSQPRCAAFCGDASVAAGH